MDAIKSVFEAKKAEGRPALVTFITAGYPRGHDTVPILLAMEAGGADIIEVGIPFSDPIADGPVIQESNNIALKNEIDYTVVLEQIKEARGRGLTAPVLLMGYYNPILAYGEDRAIEEARAAGANGFIMVDLPPEEAGNFRQKCAHARLSYVPLVAPSTSLHRIEFLASIADTFLYVVSKMGTTGSSIHGSMNSALPQLISRIREYTTLPLAVGFGVATRAHFDVAMDAGADGVVVGSRLVSVIKESPAGEIPQAVERYCCELSLKGQNPRVRLRSASPLLTSPSSSTLCNGNYQPSSSTSLPRRFGEFGGQYVPESIFDSMNQLEAAHRAIIDDPAFWNEFESLSGFMNRPSKLFFAENLTKHANGAKIWFKREDLNHTGSHNINNAVAQILLARRLGKRRIIAETGAGQHGVATASVCARFGMECVIYMGAEDARRQSQNVLRMKILGAKVITVESGSQRLKDAVNEAMRDCVTNLSTTYFLVGSCFGPHPFPTMVRDYQRVIGREIKSQMKNAEGKLPDVIVACVGGGSNAIGAFYDFIPDKSVRLVGVEGGGEGLDGNRHSAPLSKGEPGVLHGVRTYLLQSETGQISETHTIGAGLNYPVVSPEHAWLKDSGRAEYVVATDEEALRGFRLCSQLEGIIPALESSHAIWEGIRLAKTLPKESNLVICLSGRGDKDVEHVSELLLGKWADRLQWHI
ncbi:tryptophan synthase [Leucogyrophana mollusca]|uniref:Tryptophan synthase n=1 Tax=Leucogyrophana mollusca TaxID=85980 RepID=A0ACB8AY30_9AGAM|nr:tryptophan synthase [Leucogyrophana mollusca]